MSTLLLWASLSSIPAWAQWQIAPNTAVSGSGSVSVGYTGETGTDGSSHGLGVGGNAAINGYYYNPKFLSFQLTPFYNRDQSNSESSSITSTSGISATLGVFSGSRTPGAITYYLDSDKSSTFSVPGTSGLTQHGSDHGINANWGAYFDGLPTIDIAFNDSTSSSSIFGVSGGSNSSQRSFVLSSRYEIWGFRMMGQISHATNHQHLNESLGGVVEANSTNTNYSFGLQKQIPLQGNVTAQLTHADYGNGATNGSVSTFSGTVYIMPFPRFNFSATTQYSTSVLGGLEEQIVNSTGQVVKLQSATSSGSREDGRVFYSVTHDLYVTAYATRSEQNVAGSQYVSTAYGGNLNYQVQKYVRGLGLSAGVLDGVTENGNTGAFFQGAVSYTRYVGRWQTGANYRYSQSLQTADALYTTSAMSYDFGAQRRFGNGSSFTFSFNGGRTGFTQLQGYMNHNENYTAYYVNRHFTLSGSYSKSYGQALLTQSGLASVPTSVPTVLIASSSLVTYGGSGYGVGIGKTMFGKLSMTFSYSASSGSTVGEATGTTYDAHSINFRAHYKFRKLIGDAGYSHLLQNTQTTVYTHSNLNTFYIGISRWFNFF